MKYKIINSDLLINGKLIPQNSEVELSEEETKGIEEQLLPIESEHHTERSRSISEDSSTINEQKPKSKRSKK